MLDEIKDLAHHAGGKPREILPWFDPFIVGAGKAPALGLWKISGFTNVLGAEELYFLTAHDLVQSCCAATGHTGQDPSAAVAEIFDAPCPGSEAPWTGWAGNVGYFQPTSGAAYHAAHDGFGAGKARQPGLNQVAQVALEVIGSVEQAPVAG